MKPASPKQISFLTALVTERAALDSAEVAAAKRGLELSNLSMAGASAHIDRLLKIRVLRTPTAANQPKVQIPDVPAGMYALESPDGTVFFKVDRPTRGRWAGYTFLAQMHGENHEPIRIRSERDRFLAVLGDIAADVEAAARRYGHYANSCSYCRHDLTTEFSRFFGIGPVCAKRHGMPYSFAQYVKRGGETARAEVEAWLEEDGKVRSAKLAAEGDPIVKTITDKLYGDDETDDFNRRWAQHKIDFARHEAQQEAAAFMADVA